jgi:hypothetical protein
MDVFNVGEDVCYYLISKDFNGVTKTIFESGEICEGNLTNIIYKNHNEKIKYSIIDKVEDVKHEKIKWFSDIKNTDGNSAPKKMLGSGFIKNEKTGYYKYEFIHSPSQTYFCREKLSYGKLKIMFNYSGNYFDIQNPNKYMRITDSILGKQVEGILIMDENEGLEIRDLYSKKIFRFYVDNEKTGGFNTGIFKLPKIDYKKKWTDQQLYEYFNLTEEEINLIEETVKE